MSFQGYINLCETLSPARSGKIHRGIYVLFKGEEAHLGELKRFPGSSCAEKIANAFWERGVKAFSELEHDFLLFLYIPSRKRLYLVRDRFGVQPVYFKSAGSIFRFSQQGPDLTGGLQPDAASIRNYLVDFAETELQADSRTFFNGMHTVPPGSYFCKEGGDSGQCVAYWKPEPAGSPDNSDLSDKFRERLFESVTFQTRNYQRVSAHLSGGMDSSTIALVYNKLTGEKLPTFYFDISDKNHRDPYYADLVASQISAQHIYIRPAQKDIYSSLKKLSRDTGHPEFFILPSNIQYAIAEEAEARGADAILTGMDGDSVVGHGWGYLEALRRNDDWEIFINQLSRLRMLRSSSFNPDSGMQPIQRNIIERELFTLFKGRELRRLRNLMAISRKKFGYIPVRFIAYLAHRVYERFLNPSLPKDKDYFLHKDLFHLESRDMYKAAGLYEHSDQEIVDNFRAVVNGEYPWHFEQFRAIGQAYGQQYLHPFFDRKLFELCLAIPDTLRYGNGKTRWLLRNAMKDILPVELYDRHDKDDFSLYLIKSCCSLWQDNREKFEENKRLWQYIDQSRFRRQINILLAGRYPLAVSRTLARKLNRIMYLGVWLDTLE